LGLRGTPRVVFLTVHEEQAFVEEAKVCWFSLKWREGALR
jgi:hypothetical protein